MNDFQYRVTISKILKMKTLRAREAIMRIILEETPYDLLIGGWGCECKDIDKELNDYKCFIKAYSDYTGAHLPLFIHQAAKHASTAIFTKAVKDKVSYEKFCEIFEYTKDVKMSRHAYSEFLPSLAVIVGANELPFELRHDWYVSSPFSSATKLTDTTKSIDSLLEIEEVKRALPGTVRYTVVEDLLDSKYSGSTAKEISAEVVTRMTNWLTNAQTIHTRVTV